MFHSQSASAKILRGEQLPPNSESDNLQTPSSTSPPLDGKTIHPAERVLGVGALNTHFFDGKLESMMSIIQQDIERVHVIDRQAKISAFEDLHSVLKNHQLTTRNTLHCYDAIVQSTANYAGEIHNPNQNYDSANKLHADDLLYLLYEKIVKDKSEEHCALLAIQLDEMASGLCPQGRTTRLFQVYIMLRDDLTPTSKPNLEK